MKALGLKAWLHFNIYKLGTLNKTTPLSDMIADILWHHLNNPGVNVLILALLLTIL